MAKVRRGKGKVKDHDGDLDALIEYVGHDLIKTVNRMAVVTAEKQSLLIAGEIMGGIFKLTVTFNGETKH